MSQDTLADTALSSIPQAIFDKVSAYQRAEMVWMDAHVRAQWPRWICWLAERDGFFAALLRIVVARFSGIEVVRNQNLGIAPVGKLGKGFRPGRQPHKQMIDSITTTIFKHQKPCKEVVVAGGKKTRVGCTDKCVLDKQVFALGVPL